MDWKRKKVLIVGFGKSGQAALPYLLEKGARVSVTDLCPENRLENEAAPYQGHPVDWYLGEHPVELFTAADGILVSPGVPWNLKALKAAREKGVSIFSEMELALREVTTETIAVTGTNGKTTTVRLIHHLLTVAGKKAVLAGNVGKPLLTCLTDLKESEFLVLEISSYQLEATPSLKPAIAVWLNITEDHLEWHENFADYVKAKSKLVRQTGMEGRVIYNGEDTVVTQSVEQIPCQRWVFSTKRQVPLGGWVEEGRLWIKTAMSETPFSFSLEKVPLVGIHNWENMLAALLAVSPYIKDRDLLQRGLESYVLLPHRMQKVSESEGVTYINDSKATNVGATVKAFAVTPPPILWIAGGRDKGGSFEPLKEWVKKKSKKIFLFGEAKERMAEILKGCGEIEMTKDLNEAVKKAAGEAQRGDTVLFSPACSSFDMFRDYAERGDKFMEIVKKS